MLWRPRQQPHGTHKALWTAPSARKKERTAPLGVELRKDAALLQSNPRGIPRSASSSFPNLTLVASTLPLHRCRHRGRPPALLKGVGIAVLSKFLKAVGLSRFSTPSAPLQTPRTAPCLTQSRGHSSVPTPPTLWPTSKRQLGSHTSALTRNAASAGVAR